MKSFTVVIFAIFILVSCFDANKKQSVFHIETQYGTVVLELYNNTPRHKSNFMMLVNQGFYDGLLFHRVIEGFIIQGGDPDSRNAKQGIMLGSSGTDYTIEEEIKPENIHKYGAVAAARKPNSINPQRASSGSQFYIVTGKIYANEELDALENQVNSERKSTIMNHYINQRSGLREQLDIWQENENFQALDSVLSALAKEIQNDSIGLTDFKISAERRTIYTSIGGVPTLDDEYTVFGEVIEGMDIVGKISKLPTDSNNRPLYNIEMKIKHIK